MISLSRTRDAKGFTRILYALTCIIKKLFHFKREIADAKIFHFDLGAKAAGVSALGHTSLGSSFDADVKI